MSKLFNWILILGLVVFTAAHPFDMDSFPSSRIVNGIAIAIKEAPWQVSLQICPGTVCAHFCGGSIISEKWILTAAHCVAFGLETKIRAGTTNNLKGGSLVDVNRFVQHGNWKEHAIDFDYALFELSKPLNFTTKIKPIALPSKNDVLPVGTLCELSGWGKTLNISEPDNYLRKLTHPIVNQKECADNVGNDVKLTPRMICAGPKGDGISGCFGDSGGPLSCKLKNGIRKLFGIASWVTDECVGPENRTVYARVQAARGWIKSVTGL